MRRAVRRFVGGKSLCASTALLAVLTSVPSAAVHAQGSSVDIAPVDVTAKKQKPVVKRPAKPAAAKLVAPKPVAARPAARPTAKVVAPVRARVAAQPVKPPPATQPTPSAGASGTPPRGVAPAFAGGQVASGGRIGILGNTDIKKTPLSISSYTDKFFRDQQAQNINQALILSPSVKAEQSSGGTVNAFVIRGFPFNEGNVGEFAFDGMYGIAPNFRIFTDYAERIEVLLGPSAAISGVAPNGAIGGVINIVPKRALNEDLTRVTFGYGSRLNGGVQTDISRRYGAFREWGIRFAGELRAGQKPADRQSEQSKVGSLSLDYQGDRFRSWLYLLGQTDFYQAPQRPFLAAAGIQVPGAPDGRLNISQPWEYSRQYDKGGLLKTEYDLSSTVTAFADLGGSLATVNRFFGNPTMTNAVNAGDITNVPSFFDQGIKRYTYDAGIRAGFDTGFIHHNFVVQGSVYRDYITRLLNAGTAYTSNIYDPVLVPRQIPNTVGPRAPISDTLLTGVSFVDTFSVLQERVLLTAGVRRQQVANNNYLANVGTLTSSTDKYAITPIVGLVLRPTQNLSFYGNYIEGLSRGDVAPAQATNFGAILPPFISRQFEVGAKAQFGNLGTSLAAFQITKALGELDQTTMLFSSTGEVRMRGIEFNVYGELARHVRVLGGFTYLNGILAKTALATNIGNNAIGVPHNNLNIGGEIDLPWALRGLTLNGLVVYTGRQFVDAANLQPLSDWTRLDLGARYVTTLDNHRTTFRLNVQNVTGTNYYVGVASFGTFFVGDPRTYLASMSVDL